MKIPLAEKLEGFFYGSKNVILAALLLVEVLRKRRRKDWQTL